MAQQVTGCQGQQEASDADGGRQGRQREGNPGHVIGQGYQDGLVQQVDGVGHPVQVFGDCCWLVKKPSAQHKQGQNGNPPHQIYPQVAVVGETVVQQDREEGDSRPQGQEPSGVLLQAFQYTVLAEVIISQQEQCQVFAQAEAAEIAQIIHQPYRKEEQQQAPKGNGCCFSFRSSGAGEQGDG